MQSFIRQIVRNNPKDIHQYLISQGQEDIKSTPELNRLARPTWKLGEEPTDKSSVLAALSQYKINTGLPTDWWIKQVVTLLTALSNLSRSTPTLVSTILNSSDSVVAVIVGSSTLSEKLKPSSANLQKIPLSQTCSMYYTDQTVYFWQNMLGACQCILPGTN